VREEKQMRGADGERIGKESAAAGNAVDEFEVVALGESDGKEDELCRWRPREYLTSGQKVGCAFWETTADAYGRCRVAVVSLRLLHAFLNDTIVTTRVVEGRELVVQERTLTLRGEYRKLYPVEIGLMVRLERYRTGLKRLSLAIEAGVSEKTIERLERGDAVSIETLRRTAAVLGLPNSAFLTRHYIPRGTLMECSNLLESKRLLDDYCLVNTRRATDTSVILDLFRTVASAVVKRGIADEHLEAAALLTRRLAHGIGVGAVKLASASDATRVRHARRIVAAVERFEALGYCVVAGRARHYTVSDGTQVPLAVFLVTRRRLRLAPLEPDPLWLLRGLHPTRTMVFSKGPPRIVRYTRRHNREVRSLMSQLGYT
jgi:transcriptional regulator with XRE-family HTH domain